MSSTCFLALGLLLLVSSIVRADEQEQFELDEQAIEDLEDSETNEEKRFDGKKSAERDSLTFMKIFLRL